MASTGRLRHESYPPLMLCAGFTCITGAGSSKLNVPPSVRSFSMLEYLVKMELTEEKLADSLKLAMERREMKRKAEAAGTAVTVSRKMLSGNTLKSF